jgi:hypothetical protein
MAKNPRLKGAAAALVTPSLNRPKGNVSLDAPRKVRGAPNSAASPGMRGTRHVSTPRDKTQTVAVS